jgi:hypothetical protein
VAKINAAQRWFAWTALSSFKLLAVRCTASERLHIYSSVILHKQQQCYGFSASIKPASDYDIALLQHLLTSVYVSNALVEASINNTVLMQPVSAAAAA